MTQFSPSSKLTKDNNEINKWNTLYTFFSRRINATLMVNLLSVRVCLTRHGSSLESQMGWFWKYRSGFLLTFFARWIFGFVAKGDFKYSRSLGLRTNWKLSKAKRNRVKGDSKEILADISSKCNGKHWSYKRVR